MRVYVSGPISLGGTLPPEEWKRNIESFVEAAALLRSLGYEVCSPCEDAPVGLDWVDYMRRDLKMLADCDGLVQLAGWEGSRGSRLEALIAAELGFEIGTVEWFATKEAK